MTRGYPRYGPRERTSGDGKKKTRRGRRRVCGRGGQIRTDDFMLPKQALYQAELHPERPDASTVSLRLKDENGRELGGAEGRAYP